MSNPKFKLDQAVMIRSALAPEYNSDFSIVTHVKRVTCLSDLEDGLLWSYSVHNRDPKRPGFTCLFREDSLHPIPPEESNGIDAIEYIKNLKGVTA